jgi:nitrite reductase/ring-hydroxylating ferredoxin subunit
MGEFIEVSKIDELKDGTMKAVNLAGREIILAKVGGKYYAANNRCPHMGGRLSDGSLDAMIVTCPRHGAQFDLSDGHVIRWAKMPAPVSAIGKLIRRPRPLTTYVVKLEGESILVEI